MIKTWCHKGLKRFFETGDTSGIQSKHGKRLRILLGVLNSAMTAFDMDLPGFGLHRLKGNRKDYYSVKVNGNWRVTFTFHGHHAELVNYEDYH